MQFTVLHCLSLLATSFALTAPAKRDWSYTLKDIARVPSGWTIVAPAPDSHSVKLRIALPQHRFDELESHLLESSDPSHARYGQHLSMDEVHELVKPHPEHTDSVNNWLAAHGIEDFSSSGAADWIHVNLPIREAEELLKTTYHVFQHEGTGETLVRTLEYSVPAWLEDAVELIQPTTAFALFKPLRSTVSWPEEDAAPAQFDGAKFKAELQPSAAVNCTSNITLTCLAQLYNYEGYVPSADLNNSIGITGYLEEFANLQDLQSFYADQRPEALGTSFKYFSVNGGENDQNLTLSGAEAALDVQYAFGGAFPINGTFWSTGGSPPWNPDLNTPTNTNEPYVEWLDFVLGTEEVPLVISTSYADDEQTVPKDYALRVCNSYAQLGARGVSLLHSSGDGGVGDNDPNPETTTCKTNDGNNSTRFLPLFPSTCPYITSVGGTVGYPEVAVSRFNSGGGYSDYFERPSYQEDAVSAYNAALPEGTYDGLYNPAGRAHPDVSAQSDRYRIFLAGVPRLIGGTSASSPAFAAIVALLNDARLKEGKSSLGFLNPLFYSLKGEGFNDVTVGNNTGCGTSGFNATAGWDPVTGLGTPDFGLLKDIVLANP